MNKRLLTLGCIGLIFLLAALPISICAVELTWMEAESSSSTIYYSRLSEKGWSPKHIISTGTILKATPVVASKGGKALAVWVSLEINTGPHLSFAQMSQDIWQKAQPMPFDFQETTAPLLIMDDDKYLLFFAANNGDDDDIYMSIYEAGWSSPVMIHPDNTVPDILPEATYIDGSLVISWNFFDGNNYKKQSRPVPQLLSSRVTDATISQKNAVPSSIDEKRLQLTTTERRKDFMNLGLPANAEPLGRVGAYTPEYHETPVMYFDADTLLSHGIGQ